LSHVLALPVRDDLALPRHGDEEFQRIRVQDAGGKFFGFRFTRGKVRRVRQLKKIKEFIFNPRAERVARAFGDMGQDVHPQQISLFDAIQD
jgi:hypothetical protein